MINLVVMRYIEYIIKNNNLIIYIGDKVREKYKAWEEISCKKITNFHEISKLFNVWCTY